MGFLSSLRAKLLASFLVLIILTALLGLFGLSQLATLRDNSHKNYVRTTLPLVHAQAVVSNYQDYLAAITAQTSSAEQHAQLLQLGANSVSQVYASLAQLNADKLSTKAAEDARTATNQTWAAYTKYAGITPTETALPVAPPATSVAEANAQFQQAVGLLQSFSAAGTSLQAELTKGALASDKKAEDAYSKARNLLIIGLIVVTVIGIVFALVIANWFVKPIRKTVSVLGDVANGDLTKRLDVDRKDELGQMATALNGTLSTVDGVIAQIQSDATVLADQATKGSNPELASMAENLNAMTSIFQVTPN